MSEIDAARLAIFDSLVSSAAEEMGATLRHTALSPNIKERADFSCAVFDADGQALAQAAHIPVHLGAMPESVRAAASLAPWAEGDVAVLNDPYLGGTHLPDVTMVSPVFAADGPRASRGRRARPIGFVASRAHQADIGGSAPGSMPVARELIQEGLVIPPVRIMRAGEPVEETLALVLRNVRTPDERRGDFAAQIAAQRVGGARLGVGPAPRGGRGISGGGAARGGHTQPAAP
ncbi:MAG: hydantoinase B/oxoprolinase family protein, partial [Chloroflexi bacterium]|nr:hydantoinase B/oxoprolinase family protein [Chloroflexota bacterium]